ncbi:hypothetical protein BGW38_000895 [Lunasporangiospora selenospora]|uniref:Cyanovirin-N domain-containing protein n=1 Tax=Lunasporangiospora selenospora TaxID=979761 RepID=A0A9P6KEI1_9FUNG|nr:hypothetical protein BGW38_000895 [Lunasporangiospora selenospora]
MKFTSAALLVAAVSGMASATTSTFTLYCSNIIVKGSCAYTYTLIEDGGYYGTFSGSMKVASGMFKWKSDEFRVGTSYCDCSKNVALHAWNKDYSWSATNFVRNGEYSMTGVAEY